MHSKTIYVFLQLLVIHVVVTIRPMLNNVFNNLYSILCFDYKVWNGRMKKTRKSGKKNELKIRNRWGGQSLMGIIQLDGESVIFRTRRGRVVWIESPLRWVYVGGQIALAYVRLEWWMITGRTIRGRVGGWMDWGMDGWKKRVSNAWINGFMDRHMDRLMSGYVDLLMDWFLSISMYCRRWLKSVAEANKTHCSLWSNFTSTASEVWSKQLCLH